MPASLYPKTLALKSIVQVKWLHDDLFSVGYFSLAYFEYLMCHDYYYASCITYYLCSQNRTIRNNKEGRESASNDWLWLFVRRRGKKKGCLNVRSRGRAVVAPFYQSALPCYSFCSISPLHHQSDSLNQFYKFEQTFISAPGQQNEQGSREGLVKGRSM